MPDPIIDPLPITDPPPPADPVRPPHSGGSMVCGYCGCTLDAAGHVLRRGREVTRVMDLEDQIRERDKALKLKADELAAKDAEIAALKGAPATRKRSDWLYT